MSLGFVLQLGWRIVLAIAMSATPWSAHARVCAMAASATQAQTAMDARAADSAMPCHAAMDSGMNMGKQAGTPHPRCPQGDCDNAACVGHCMVLAALPVMPTIAIAQQRAVLIYTKSSAPDQPSQERLRPPIA